MMTQSLHRPVGRGAIYGAIGGFVGGLVMYAVMSAVMLAIDMGANCFTVIIALITATVFKRLGTIGDFRALDNQYCDRSNIWTSNSRCQ
jgi:predicted lipid-binding transport protein (Tim44 family)